MTVTDHIRQHILVSRGVEHPDYTESEWSPTFEALMRNRLIMGAYRYVPLTIHSDHARVKRAIAVLQAYQVTGNMELLVDAANYCLLEFIKGDQANRHWAPIDDGEHCPKESR